MSNNETRDRAVVNALLKGFEARDVQAIIACCAEDVVFMWSSDERIEGHQGIRDFADTYFKDKPKGRCEVHLELWRDGVVVNERTDYVTIQGKEMAVRGCGVFETRDGLVTAYRDYWDPGWQKNLGVSMPE